MSKIAILVCLLLALYGGASYAANIGDIVGGYPAGYNPNNPGDFREHVGEPVTPTFIPTATAQTPTTGIMEGPLPAGFSYDQGNDFFEDLQDQETVDISAKRISLKRSALAKNSTLDFADNLTVVVTGNNAKAAGNLLYYVGYKLVSIAW
jgi:hypothetical protein